MAGAVNWAVGYPYSQQMGSPAKLIEASPFLMGMNFLGLYVISTFNGSVFEETSTRNHDSYHEKGSFVAKHPASSPIKNNLCKP